MINWFTLIKKSMQAYIVIVSESILNVSTVHLNGIWHLIWCYLSKPVSGGHPVLSGHYSIPRGFTVPASPSHRQFPLAKFRCKLSPSCQVMFSTSHSRCSLPWWIAKAFAVKWRMLIAWICSQELGFVLKSEQREALELLLRGKDVFCVLPTGFDKSLIYRMFVHAKSSSSSVQRPTVIVISPG